MTKNRKIMVRLLQAAIIILMAVILYFMFKDSYKDILQQLSKTNMLLFILIVVLGNTFYFADAFVYTYLFKREKQNQRFLRCLAMSYMGVFFNVTTFGAGIKPAQVMYAHNKGTDVGKALGITSTPYIYHKTVIVVYAVVMLIFNNKFVVERFSSTFGYIYAGVFLSLGIIIFLILICSSEWFHKLVFKLLYKTIGKTRFIGVIDIAKTQVDILRDATKQIIKNPLIWLRIGAIDIFKMSCWYVIPIVSLYAAGGELGGITVAQALTITSLMQLIMGVIPTSGGVGSLEVVFSLMFAAVFGSVMTGACVVLYRLGTYYIPFLISIFIMIYTGKNMRKKDIDKVK